MKRREAGEGEERERLLIITDTLNVKLMHAFSAINKLK